MIGVGAAAWFESFQFAVWVSSPRYDSSSSSSSSRLRWLHQIIYPRPDNNDNKIPHHYTTNNTNITTSLRSSSTTGGAKFTLLPGDDEHDERDERRDSNDGDGDSDGRGEGYSENYGGGGGGGGGGIAMSTLPSPNHRVGGNDEDYDDDTTTGGGGGGVGDYGDKEDREEEEEMCWIPCGRVLWRFLPDILSILLLVCLTPLISNKETQGWLWFVAIPFLFLAIITLSMSQQGLARGNLTRYL